MSQSILSRMLFFTLLLLNFRRLYRLSISFSLSHTVSFTPLESFFILVSINVYLKVGFLSCFLRCWKLTLPMKLHLLLKTKHFKHFSLNKAFYFKLQIDADAFFFSYQNLVENLSLILPVLKFIFRFTIFIHNIRKPACLQCAHWFIYTKKLCTRNHEILKS